MQIKTGQDIFHPPLNVFTHYYYKINLEVDLSAE